MRLSAASPIAVDAVLELGSIEETITVQASPSSVQTTTGQVARTIDTRQIQALSLNGRNPIFLASLKPGVQGGTIGTFDPDSVTNGNFSINGARADEYVVMVDGAIATRTRSSGSMIGAQDVETVEEVQVLTASYRAEYGRSSAGQIRFVTKSGTQQFHGDWRRGEGEHTDVQRMWVTGARGPYHFEFMTQVSPRDRDAVRRDGIFGNRWSGSGMCDCEHCQRNFHSIAGGGALRHRRLPRCSS